MSTLVDLVKPVWSRDLPHADILALRAAIEAAADEVSKADYVAYCDTWQDNPESRAAFEHRFPVLALLHAAARHVSLQVTHFRPDRGFHLYHLYNMGFILRAASGATIGIDLHAPGLLPLASHLDALLISHIHPDHRTPGLIEEMLRLGKPVLTNFAPGTTLVTTPTQTRIADLDLAITIGDHFRDRPDCINNMLMFHLTTPDGASLYHIGDNNNAAKLSPAARNVSAFIFHVQVGLNAPQALAFLTPGLAIGAHLLELRHDVGIANYRWPYYIADQQLTTYPPGKTWVPLWGQHRHILPNP